MIDTAWLFFPSCSLSPSQASESLEVRRVDIVLETDEVFLDAPGGDEAVEDRDASRLVVRPACARTTEWLLTDDSTSALLVVVDVARGVAQTVRRMQESLAVRGKAVCDCI